ncbi:MAG: ATP-binding protein [Cytophagales bacterium]|jgi:nicotinamide riboside kinase|nr:ATP-binding protein [Cytophagales bacterium]
MKKISIVGPESSGKSTLALSLSQALECNYCDEYARKYLEKKSNYNIHDLEIIAKKQNKKIEEGIKGGGDYIISDTCVLDIELWSKIKFKRVDEKISQLSTKEEFDIYLLCKPDIPWKYDKLRENEHTREFIYKEFKSIMKKRSLNYFVIGGSLVKRITSSLDIIKNN